MEQPLRLFHRCGEKPPVRARPTSRPKCGVNSNNTIRNRTRLPRACSTMRQTTAPLRYAHTACLLRMHKRKKCLFQDDKVNSLLNLHYNIAHNFSQIHTSFEMSCYHARWFNKSNTWMRFGVARFLAGQSARLSDTLQIPSGCIQIRSGCIAPTCTLLPTDLN